MLLCHGPCGPHKYQDGMLLMHQLHAALLASPQERQAGCLLLSTIANSDVRHAQASGVTEQAAEIHHLLLTTHFPRAAVAAASLPLRVCRYPSISHASGSLPS